MVLLEELKDRGWFLSAEGLEECTDGLENPKAEDVIRKAVNFDLVDIGEGGLPEDVSRNKVESITGPVVVQIQKIRNVAAPKSNPESDHSPRLLRLHLTDGTSYCSAIQWGRWSNISLSTPPGSKILLKDEPIPVVNGFLLLAERNFKFLGGNVAHLIEKWELAKNLSHHKRIAGDEGAAPPWVPFGQKIEAGGLKNLKGSNFKSMDLCQKDTKPNESFEKHRQMTIAEISRAKEGKVKVFGGGKQQPQDGDIAQLVGYGYSVDAAVNALKTHNCDIAAAMQALELSDRNRRERANKPETGRKRREPRDRDSADEKAPSRPSGPSTLFDYLQNQISLPKVPDVEDSHAGDRPSSEANPGHDHHPDRSHGSSRGRAANGPSANGGRFGQQQHGPSQRYRGQQEPRRGDGGDHSYQNHFHDGSSGYQSNSGGPYNRHREGGGNGPGQQSRSNQGGYGNRNQARQPPAEAGDRRRPPPPQACDLAPGSRPPPRDRSFADSKPPGPKRLYSGQKVLAKYWEDGKFYRAVVHEVSANGNTCVVKFVDYGNHEEVLCSDVQTVSLAQWEKGQSSSSRPEYHRQAAGGTGGSAAGADGSSHQGPPVQQQQQQRHFNSSRDSEDYRYLEAMMQNEAAATQHHHQQQQQQPPPPPPPQQQQHQLNYHHNYHQQQQHHQSQYQPQHQRPPGDNYEHGGYRQRPPPHHKPQHQPFGGSHGRPQQQFYQPPAQRRQGPPA